MSVTDPTYEALRAENARLRQRVAALEQLVERCMLEQRQSGQALQQSTTDEMQGDDESLVGEVCREESLRESEALFRGIFEHATIGIFQSTTDGRFLAVNPALARMLGYDSAAHLIESVTNIAAQLYVRPELRNEIVRQIQENDGAVRLENYYYRRDGRVLIADLNVWTVRDAAGHVRFLEGTVEDITERKVSEEALRRSEERYRSVVAAMQEGVVLVDASGAIITWNASAERILGLQKDEMGQRTIPDPRWQTIYEDGSPFPADDYPIVRTLRTGRPCSNVIMGSRRPDGAVCWMSINTQPLFHAGETQPYAAVASFADITERRRMEEQLHHSRALLQSIVDNAPAVVYVKDVHGRYLLANQHLARLMRLDQSAIVGKMEHELFPPEVIATWRLSDEQIIATGEPMEREEVFQLEDGEHTQIMVKFPIVDEQGAIYATSGIATDITARKQAEEQVQRQVDYLSALRQIDMAITASLDLRLTLDVVLDQVLRHLAADAADVLLLAPHTQMLEYAAGRGFHKAALRRFSLRPGETHVGRVVQERQLISIADLREIGDVSPRMLLLLEEGLTAYYGVPLIVKGQVKGVLELFYQAAFTPDQEWLMFLDALATQTAIAIDNAELFETLQRVSNELVLAYDATIEGWARALELRDAETEGHTRRVTEMTVMLARAMGFDDMELVHIRRGAILHDIGKMAIPDTILLKPGPLTDEEWVVMRQHPVYAYHMLSSVHSLRSCLDIPHYHHERWDGSGYPDGLKGQEIPLVARLFAVVDVWDALSSDRPYRKAWPRERVYDYVREQSGSHFDPAVVEIFLRLMSNPPR